MVRLYRQHAEAMRGIVTAFKAMLKNGAGGSPYMGNPGKALVPEAVTAITGTRLYFSDTIHDTADYNSLTVSEMEEVLKTAIGETRDANGDDTDLDLVDTIARLLRLPFTANFGNKQMIKQLRDALMNPSELRQLKAMLPNIELSCAACGNKLKDRELIIYRAENGSDPARIYCYKCVHPSYVRCKKCLKIKSLTDGILDSITQCECVECADAAAAARMQQGAPEVASTPPPFVDPTPRPRLLTMRQQLAQERRAAEAQLRAAQIPSVGRSTIFSEPQTNQQ
jgi:hypothetical protein